MVSWFAQNLQRRLLLYFLQKVSLFSQVDISALDVSLGSSSHFTFHDLDLDVDNIDIPDVTVRSGFLKQLELRLTVSGGLSVEGSGIAFVVKPNLSRAADSQASSFSLTKTVYDLTSSVMHMDAKDGMLDDEMGAETNSSRNDSRETDSDSAGAPSVLQAMRNKALDVVLSKLSINLRNISVKFLFSENHTVELTLEEVSFVSANVTREIKLSGLIIAHIKKPWETEEDDPNSKTESTMSDSLIYSKVEATSIYMSAIQSVQELENHVPQVPHAHPDSEILSVNNLNVSFKGFSSIDDISMRDAVVDFDECRIDLPSLLKLNDPIILPLILLVTAKTKSKIKDIGIQTPQNLQNYRRFREEQDLHDDLQFSKLRGTKISILLSKGLVLELGDINVVTNEKEQLELTLKGINLIHNSSALLMVSECNENPLIQSTIDLNSGDVKTKILEKISIHLDTTTLFDILQCSLLFQKCLKTWNQNVFKAKKTSADAKPRGFELNGKPVEVNFNFESFRLNLLMSDFSVSFPGTLFKAEKVQLKFEDSAQHKELMTVSNIEVKMLPFASQHDAFNHSFDEVVVSSKCQIRIKKIELAFFLELIGIISPKLEELITQMSTITSNHASSKSTPKKSQRHMRRSVRIMGSSAIISKQSSSVECFVDIGSIVVCLEDALQKSFGDLKGHLGGCSLYINSDQTFTGYARDLHVKRLFRDNTEPLMEVIHVTNDFKPVFTIHRKLTGKLCCALRTVCFYYYARWLDFVSQNREQETTTRNKSGSAEVDSLSLDVKLTDCAISFSPYRLKSQLLLVLGKCAIELAVPSLKVKTNLRSTSILLIDDLSNFNHDSNSNFASLPAYYVDRGFVNIGKLDKGQFSLEKSASGLIVTADLGSICLFLCADSMQALVQVALDLGIPLTFPDDQKYRTKPSQVKVFEGVEEEYFTNQRLQLDPIASRDELFPIFDDSIGASHKPQSNESTNMPRSTTSENSCHTILSAQDNYINTKVSRQDQKSRPEEMNVGIKLNLTLNSATLKLYDGFDWAYTRRSISDLINQIESELQQQISTKSEPVKASVFDSIYLFAGSDVDADVLRQQINKDLQSEPSISIKGSPKKLRLRPSKNYKARIEIAGLKASILRYSVDDPTELTSDMSADTLNDIKLLIENVEVIDNVPTSTWNKLASYWKEEPRAKGSDMISLDIKTVRPVDFLAATELILKVRVLPLRLHIDQDTLDFLMRFFEFKDSRFELVDEYPDFVYIQKLEVQAVKIKMDYKPKTVDYAGLKSGHTSEFMNFFILEGSKLRLRHVVVYGINGFPELNKLLNSIWMPDITGKQLQGILGGVAPMKTIVTLGTGVKALVSTPIKEYKRDQSLGRGLQKGTQVFIKVTTGEFVRLGVKLASGTQAMLENAEEFMGGEGPQARNYRLRDVEVDVVSEDAFLKYEKLVGGRNPRDDQDNLEAFVVEPGATEKDAPKIFSLYADQPASLKQGLKEAQGSFGKNVQLAYDAVRKAQNEIRESGNAQETVSSFARVVPVALLRPIIGATEALSKALQGISNGIDDEQIALLKDKYKSQN
ncbi:LANO_0E00342g1_1 [Lachancea nothofagi CBS 11611]|uniref:Autophagy-related protein 2 n=1 Tax=Lachancea nothofagi CBS 11611 TaxID=1266666 RepID=A0A1G4JNT9_9SACH|nr:LANO_0E00342g1_1 [Lachancea nothofagi CBS 11611]